MKTNVANRVVATTFEGGRADPRLSPLAQLKRMVSTCLLFEDNYYEGGSKTADQIRELCARVYPEQLARIAIDARNELNLRHIPLFLAVQFARLYQGTEVGEVVSSVIRRPDEMAEFLSLYWNERQGGRGPTAKLSAQVKRGLRIAFSRFSAHALAKWNRDGSVKLRDVLFLCHAKPKDDEQAALWKQLIDGTLPVPDTWETALSVGQDKRATWERLLRESQLGYQALLMNLRNMVQAGVDQGLIESALADPSTGRDKMFPYRFLTAARYAPNLAEALSDAMVASLENHPMLSGNTVLVVDVSGSMDQPLSSRSDARRLDAADALAVLLRETAYSFRCYTFSDGLKEVPNYRGLALAEAVERSQPHNGTYLAAALNGVRAKAPSADRVIVITDEQSQDGIAPAWTDKAYLINVAPYEPGLDTSAGWTRINGWSDRVVDYIRAEESVED